MKNKFQSFEDGMRMAGGSIQHPLSIHSASIGTCRRHRVWQVLMTLVFLFTLSIGQMWATATNFHDFVAAGDTIIDLEGSGSTPSAKFTAVNGTDWAAVSTSAKNNSIYRMNPSTEEVATSKTSVYGTKLGSSAKSTYKVTGVSNVIFYVGTGTAERIAYLDVTENGKSKVSEAASVTLSDKNNAYKMSYALDASKSYTLEAYASSDLFCYAVKFTVASKCNDPAMALSLTSDAAATIYVGDEITFSTTGGNGGAVTIAGAASETITANKWTATEGTHTFTASQAKNGDYCAQEDELVLTVLTKNPVTAVTVAGAASGYKNNKVIFAATAANATQYRWTVDGVAQGSDSAKLHFTPTESKTYSIVCEAKNTFNSDWIASSAHSLTVTSLYGGLINFTAKTSSGNIDEDLPAANIGGVIGGTVHQKTQKTGKLGGSGHYVSLQLASGSFQAGDTVRIVVKPEGDNHSVPGTLMLSSLLDNSKIIGSVTGLSAPNSDNITADIILTTSASIIYLSRDGSVTTQNPIVVSMEVIRPMPVKSKAYDLTAVKINGTAITAADLATLKTGDAYLLDLATEYPEGPTVKFARQTTNTYEDDSQKVLNDTITVTATEVSSKWQAQATIGTTTYTVKMAKSAATAKVYYYDGATKLGEEIVGIGDSPVNAGDYDDKTLASFVGWYNNSDLADEYKIADMSAVTIDKDTAFYGKWTYSYANSINIEQWTLTNGAGKGATTKTSALISEIGSHNFAHNLAWADGNLELDSLSTKSGRNEPYLGLKVKVGGKMLDFRLAKDSYVKVKFGEIKSTLPQVSINGGEYENMVIAEKVWSYTATGNDYISIKTADANAVVFKQIMINEDIAAVTLPWRVTYNAGTGTCATAEAIWSGSPLILPDVTPAEPTDYTFAGWYDEETGGELKGIAGASYTPADNETLFAHFAPVEYSVTYVGGEGATGSMGPEAKGWGLEYTALANTFEKYGHVFSGWAVTGVDGVSTIPALGSFTMPKNNVTLTAIWTDNSKVAQIVETNVKYESFAAAIAAVQADQTIQLLQDCEYSTYWNLTIADTVTLDLNGKNLTYTGTKRGVQVSNGGTLVLKDGTATVAPTIDLTTSPMARTAINYTSGVFDSKDGMCALAGSEIVINSGTYLATEGVILVKGPAATATVNDGVLICRDNSVVSGNGTNSADYRNYVMNIHGGILYGEIFSTGYASMVVYHPNVGELNIDGGILVSTNGPCVVTRGGETNITGGTLVALGSGSGKCGDASLVLPAVGIAVDFKSAYPGVASTDVAVSGTVDVTGQAGAVQAVYVKTDDPTAAEMNAISVSGGTFSSELSNAVCAEGYVPSSADPVTGKFTVVPKDGVCLVKIEPTSQTKGTQTGLYPDGDELTINLSSGMNLGGSGKYIGVKATENFQEGDVLHLNMSTYQNNQDATAYVYADKNASVFLFDTEEKCDENKDYYITMPAAVNGHNELYIVRTDGNKWNGGPSVMEVTRAMKPMLTAITINGRAGVIDEANKTVAVTIPYESVLSSLTVVPTVVWNEAAAENSIVVNNGAAWTLGANTYKLTDKDGDYTVYTITLTRDVLKYAVKFYDGETLLETLEVEDGTSIAAGDVPADPEKEDYIFQGWAETAGGDVVDVTSFTISAAKNFYAKWAADGAIKLINKTSGAVNEDGYFITGVTATEANSEKAAAWGGTQGANISGVNDLGKIVQYNATTNQTKIKIKVYNTNNNDKYVYIHKIIEGKTTEESVETLTATSKTPVESEYYEFNDTKNRSFYITTNSTDVKILQVKVIDNGTTPMKQAGEAGYSLNLNKGRVVYYANSDVTFEGLALQSGSNYSVISSSELQTTKNISFSIASPVLLKVTTNSAKYYVSQDPDEDGTTATAVTAAGTAEFELTTTGTWYLVPSTTSNVKYTNIAFELPKAEEPVITTQPATNHTFDPGDMTATVVATVSEGTLHYQWYKKATVGDDEEVGTDDATLTTTVEGTYYVVVTNVLAGHQNISVTSEEATLGYRVTNDATLMALSYGTPATAITLEDGVYTYAVELAKGTTDVPALAATATMDGYATVTISNAPAFVNYAASSTVTVKSEDATVTNVYTVNFTVKYDLPQVDVTASTVWNWANAATTMQTIEPAAKNVEQLMANIDDEGKQLKNDAEFNSQALIFSGQEALTGNSTRWYAKGGHIKFNVTVPGIVEVEFSDNGTNNRRVKINNAVSTVASANNTDVKTYKAYVQPGEVTLMGVKNDGTGVDQYIRISKITFTANPTPDYYRDVTNNIGTLCVDHNVLAGGFLGATFYQIVGRNQEYDYKIDFEEVAAGEELKAGEPYIFQSATGRIELYYGETVAAQPVPVRGMIGNYAAGHLEITEENKADILYIAQNKLWTCEDLVGTGLTLNPNRAYIQMSAVPSQNNVVPTPGRRRITLGRNSEQVVTGFENLNAGEQAVKLIIDGKMYILRGEKMYDATGRLVK